MKEYEVYPTICHSLLGRAKTDGNKVGFRYKKGSKFIDVTFSEQLDFIRRLGVGLMKLGVTPGDSVAVIAHTSIHWARMDMAVMGVKAKIIPIYPTSTLEDMEYIMNHGEIKYVYLDTPVALRSLKSIWGKCQYLKTCIANFNFGENKTDRSIVSYNTIYTTGLNNDKELGVQFEENLKSIKPEDIHTICYTSGTTGKPKGVVLLHSSMASVMKDLGTSLRHITTQDESVLSFLPMSHILGRMESYLPYSMGWTQVFAESIEAVIRNLAEVRPTIFFAVPRIFEKAHTKISFTIRSGSPLKEKIFQWATTVGSLYLEEKRKYGSASILVSLQYKLAEKLIFSKIKAHFGGKLKICICGGAPLPNSIADFMKMSNVPIFQGYGLTETAAPISVNLPGQEKRGTVGLLLPEVLVKIAEDGEILIKSKKVFKEYYKDKEATAESLKDGWFYTGDIGYLDDDGYLKITDRKKDLIKTAGGKFVAPQRIESLAKSSSYLNQVVVYGDEKPFITALVTLHQDAIIQYATKEKIIFSGIKELVKNEKILKLVKKEVQEINRKIPKWEAVKRFHILPEELTVEKGQLTPSLKIKRKKVTGEYKAELDQLYQIRR